MSRSGKFYADRQTTQTMTDKTDCFTPCTCVRDNRISYTMYSVCTMASQHTLLQTCSSGTIHVHDVWLIAVVIYMVALLIVTFIPFLTFERHQPFTVVHTSRQRYQKDKTNYFIPCACTLGNSFMWLHLHILQSVFWHACYFNYHIAKSLRGIKISPGPSVFIPVNGY